MLHTKINTCQRFAALMELKSIKAMNRVLRGCGLPPYSRNEVRQIILLKYGWQ